MSEQTIIAAIVAPSVPVQLRRIPNTLEALHAIVGGEVEQIPVSVGGAVGYCNERGLELNLPINRPNEPTRSWVRGTFVVVAIKPPDMVSLTREQCGEIDHWFGTIENWGLVLDEEADDCLGGYSMTNTTPEGEASGTAF